MVIAGVSYCIVCTAGARARTHTHTHTRTHTHTHLIIIKVPIIKLLDRSKSFKDGVIGAYNRIGGCFRSCCISLNKLAIILVIPEEDGANTPFNKITLIFMVLYLFTLAAQDDAINNFKCGCAEIDDLAFAKRCAIKPPPSAASASGQDWRCSEAGKQCFAGYCTTHWSGVSCVNPYANPLTKVRHPLLNASLS